MYEKSDLKLILDVYLGFEGKYGLRKKLKALIEILGYETVKEFLKDEKYITEAVKLKDLELAKLLYKNGSVIPNSLLKIAIDNHDEAMLDFLLDIGIDINECICDETGYYEPIVYFVKEYYGEQIEIAKKMLKRGANPNAKIGNYTILEYYLRYSNLYSLYIDGGIDIISLLLENGATVNTTEYVISSNAAYNLDLETFKKLTKGKYNILAAIGGAISGNNSEVLRHILTIHREYLNNALNIAIDRNAGINTINTILKFSIPKNILKEEIKHLRNIKKWHKIILMKRIEFYKYHQMLSALKKAKRKAKA